MTLRRNVSAWLLWLAFLLPIAQAMAGVHALSHVGEAQDEGIAHVVDCDLCVTAAHLAGCAPAAKPGRLPESTAVDAVITARPAPAVAHKAHRRPPARAPPLSA